MTIFQPLYRLQHALVLHPTRLKIVTWASRMPSSLGDRLCPPQKDQKTLLPGISLLNRSVLFMRIKARLIFIELLLLMSIDIRTGGEES